MIGSEDFMEKMQGNISVCVSDKLEYELRILDEQILNFQNITNANKEIDII